MKSFVPSPDIIPGATSSAGLSSIVPVQSESSPSMLMISGWKLGDTYAAWLMSVV